HGSGRSARSQAGAGLGAPRGRAGKPPSGRLLLEQLYDWEKVEDPVTRRFSRASTLAWTPGELKALTSPEDQARLDFERMLQLLLDEAGSM
ncbi:hypothetical protein OV208_25285, partial [Corallococcus sp. bb12-1]|uniref:hypothetical protein n=1 Tax=Corallococcus sp. bb12-1 TaxID=2996784 RepID=UPI00226F810C